MGKTYKKSTSRYDDEFSSSRSGKHAKHANGRKTGGMRTINSYVDEDIDFDEDIFDEEVEMSDNIHIQHNTNTN